MTLKQMTQVKMSVKRTGTEIEFRIGPYARGPARCARCQQLFKRGESWRRLSSPLDPVHGAYVIGIHDRCRQTMTAYRKDES